MKLLIVFFAFIPMMLFAQENSLHRYYELLRAYQQGKKDYVVLPYLAYTSLALKKNELANSIAHDYIDNYLLNMKGESFYSVANLNFVWQFNQNSQDKIFKLFYENADKIDKSVGIPGYSRNHLDYIIAKEEIDPYLLKDGDPNHPIDKNPDWSQMFLTIRRKYNEVYAQRTIINAKLRWFQYKNDSIALAKTYIEKFNQYGLDTLGVGKFMVNNTLYNFIFKHSEDTADLKKAVKWMELLISSYPENAGFLDTYANLLYKIGKNEQALKWEEKAINLAPNDLEIKTTWNKMKLGQPTWNERKNVN